jgi:feruloyl-CoA synthase
VSVGTLRPDVVAAASPYLQDVVVAGQDKPFIGILAWPSAAALQTLAEAVPGSDPRSALAALAAEKIAAFNAVAGGSSRRIARMVLLETPPSIDAGEITDKGYVNQRAALAARSEAVERLYRDVPGDGVIEIGR